MENPGRLLKNKQFQKPNHKHKQITKNIQTNQQKIKNPGNHFKIIIFLNVLL
mgnify:CR=1 FL=1